MRIKQVENQQLSWQFFLGLEFRRSAISCSSVCADLWTS